MLDGSSVGSNCFYYYELIPSKMNHFKKRFQFHANIICVFFCAHEWNSWSAGAVFHFPGHEFHWLINSENVLLLLNTFMYLPQSGEFIPRAALRPPSPGVNRRCSSQSPRVHVTDVQIHYEPIYEPKKIIPCVSSASAKVTQRELPAALSAILHKKSKTIVTYARTFALFMCCEE